MAEGEGMSKSAKRRAAEKRRAAAAEEEAAPAPTPAPAAKSKAAAKSAPAAAAASPKAAAKSAPAAAKAAATPAEAAPKGKAKAEAKADSKASAKAAAKSQPAPASAKANPKSQAAPAPAAEPATGKKKKGGAAVEVAPAPAPVQASAKAQPAGKSAAKSKAKAEPKPAPEPEPANPFAVFDDGTGGDWDTAVGVSKKDKKRKDKKEEEKENEQPLEKRPLYKTDAPAGGSKGKGKGSASQTSAPRSGKLDMEALTKAVQAEAAAKVAAYAITNAKEGDAAAADVPKAPLFQRTLELPSDKIGRVIGPKGANIAKIQEHFDGKINRIDTSGGFCVISGEDEESVGLAETAIKELISRGYMSISFKDLKEDTVTVKSMYLPEIIGKGGAVIKKIKEVTKVEIDIEGGKGAKGAAPIEQGGKGSGGKGGKGDDSNKPVKIQLAGEAEGVAEAKKIIESICKYYCHPAVHEDMIHKEMEIEQDNHRYVIGRGGSEMRHIQKNWNVKVNLPKWDWEGNLLTENENVVVVGSEHDVERAAAYIEKTIANALDENKKRDENPGGAPKGEDKFDKDEQPEEAWMKPYIYKR